MINYEKKLEEFIKLIKDNFKLGVQIPLIKRGLEFHCLKDDFSLLLNKIWVIDEDNDEQKNIIENKWNILQGFCEEMCNRKLLLKTTLRTQNSETYAHLAHLITNEEILEAYTTTFNLYNSSINNKVFMAREFGNDENYAFYLKLKNKLVEETGLNVVMLEEMPRSGNLNKRINDEIKTSDYFIADLTHELNSQINLNVMYEIGLAHGYKKKTLLIMEESVYPFDKKEKLPFDINNHTTLQYSYNDIDASINEIIDCIKLDLINYKK